MPLNCVHRIISVSRPAPSVLWLAVASLALECKRQSFILHVQPDSQTTEQNISRRHLTKPRKRQRHTQRGAPHCHSQQIIFEICRKIGKLTKRLTMRCTYAHVRKEGSSAKLGLASLKSQNTNKQVISSKIKIQRFKKYSLKLQNSVMHIFFSKSKISQ